jgi:hypothetical protein
MASFSLAKRVVTEKCNRVLLPQIGISELKGELAAK